MALSQVLTRVGILVSVAALFAVPAGAVAGEQHLEFKLITHPIDVKSVEAPNIADQRLSAGKFFGVAYFSDGRIAVRDFISASDLLKGSGSIRGYSTYTFEDGSSITASFVGEIKQTGLHGTYTILSGTGAYDKATGTGNFDSVPAKFKDGATLFNGRFDVKAP
jgi:hypothetical protein